MSLSRKPVRLIKKSEIAGFFSMPEAIDAMATAFSFLSLGKGYVPKRYIVNSQDDFLSLLMKPAFVQNQNTASIKILTQKNGRPVAGIPTILGIVLLIDTKTGEILSIMDGESITALRTGAASGLATKYLAREDARHFALFGCGTQGRTQLEAISSVRNLEKIWVFDKSPQQAESLIAEMKNKVKAAIEFTDDLSVLRDVDIICTATNSPKPLFIREHIKSGVHINAVGSFRPDMQELDPQIVQTARSWFDDQESCLNESGDYVQVFKGQTPSRAQLAGEIGACVLNRIGGRENAEEITIFKSVGTAIQDYVVADKIYEKSLEEHFGQDIRFYE